MNERIKALRKELSLNQGELADKLKLSRSHISSLENGVREITERIIFDICREFSVNEKWLRTGEGEMFTESDDTILEELAREYNLDSLDKKIIENFIKLNSEHRAVIKDYIFSLVEESATSEVDPTEVEVEAFRQEIKAEKKGKTLLALDERDRESS